MIVLNWRTRSWFALLFGEVRLQPRIVEELPCSTSVYRFPFEHAFDKLYEHSFFFPLHVRNAVFERDVLNSKVRITEIP